MTMFVVSDELCVVENGLGSAEHTKESNSRRGQFGDMVDPRQVVTDSEDEEL